MYRSEGRKARFGMARWWAFFSLLLLGPGACGDSNPEIETPGVTLVADPNPIQVCDGTGLGQTRIAWFREDLKIVQLRIGKPDGRLFVKSGAHGTAETGKWVREGTRIYLLDDSSNDVLASLTLRLTTSNCDQ